LRYRKLTRLKKFKPKSLWRSRKRKKTGRNN
jgi:hypothetical protein